MSFENKNHLEKEEIMENKGGWFKWQSFTVKEMKKYPMLTFLMLFISVAMVKS